MERAKDSGRSVDGSRSEAERRGLAAWGLLTEREKGIASQLGAGLGDKGIARRLEISAATVARHLRNIRAKLGLSSRAQIVKVLFFQIIERERERVKQRDRETEKRRGILRSAREFQEPPPGPDD